MPWDGAGRAQKARSLMEDMRPVTAENLERMDGRREAMFAVGSAAGGGVAVVWSEYCGSTVSCQVMRWRRE